MAGGAQWTSRHRVRPLARAATVLVAGSAFAACTAGSGPTGTKSPAGPAPTLEPTTAIVERQTEVVGAGGVRLGATLTIPVILPGQAAVPAVVIVGGLGALDRDAVAAAGTPDGTNDALSSTLSPSSPGRVDPLFGDLAQALARAGVASLRYDKRGTAASHLRPDQPLSLDDEVADARAALELLTQRREVGDAPIGVVGHDLGGNVAVRAAAGNRRVKAAVLVSTPGRPLVDVLADDFTRSRGTATADRLRAAVATLQSTGKAPAPEDLSPLVRPLFPTGADDYVRALLAQDVVADAETASMSVLLVRGGADPTVTAADVDRLKPAFGEGSEVLVADAGADHNLALHDPTGRDTPTLDRLASWLRSRLPV